MTFEEYQIGVRETWNSETTLSEQINNAILGLAGEFGEFCELRKKFVYHGISIDYDKEKKELGDILYYLTILIALRGYDLGRIAEENYRKLTLRYPNGFKEGGGIRK